jgi:hypothetical protein
MSGTAEVNAYMKGLRHPLKAEIEAVRAIILGASKKIAERVKWNAPSFYYKKDLAAFHLRPRDYVHVVFVFPQGTMPADRFGLLEGDYKDRRMARFSDMADIRAKKAGLIRLVKHWVRAMDDAEPDDSLPKIGNPATRALAGMGITRLSQVAKSSQAELGQLHGVGPKALGILEKALADRGQAFAKTRPAAGRRNDLSPSTARRGAKG